MLCVMLDISGNLHREKQIWAFSHRFVVFLFSFALK